MSINYIEYGDCLHNTISKAGHKLYQVDGVWVSSDDEAVQLIIDNYDPLHDLQEKYKSIVNTKAGKARLRYVTDIPFQEAAYQAKEEDVRRYKKNGYPDDLTLYPFTASEAEATGKAPKDAANDIIIQADSWVFLSSKIEGLRRKATIEIKNCAEWRKISEIADFYIKKLEAI